MPLNIEMDDETFGQSQYNSGSKEAAKAGNTGFIVGSGSTTTRFNTNDFSIKTRLVGQLCNSMQGGSPEKYAWKTLTYTDTINSQLQILTKDINGNYYVIGDNVNKLTSESTPFSVYSNVGITVKTLQQLGLTQYDGSTANQVRTKLARMLKSNKNLNGLCFPLYSSPSETNLLTFGGNTISMGGKDVNSLVKNSIHFVVEKAGVITMVAATVSSKYDELPGESYNTATAAYVLPMLYQVKRYANGDIEKLIPVKYICRDNTTNDIEILSALTSSGTAPEGKTLLFNYDTMSRLTTGDNSNADKAYMDSLFYFEIPIGAGEYVLGSSGSSSAYLLYLDIGANAGKDLEETPDGGDGTGGTGTPEDSDEKGTIEGVAFAYKSGDLYVQIIKIVKDGNGKDVAIVVTFDFSLKDKSSNAHTGATAKFTGTAPTGSNAASVTTSNNNTGQFTITENDTGSG